MLAARRTHTFTESVIREMTRIANQHEAVNLAQGFPDFPMPEPMKDAFPPEKVSPAVVWLCTDEAKEVTGRQFLVAGNNVSLLSWQITPIASKEQSDAPWNVKTIGEKILASKEKWPPINPMRG